MSDRSEAIEAASKALWDTNWRAWGALTVARKVVKGLEAAGYEIVRKSDQFDGTGCDTDV